jgi:carboxyl-terminal processing protease
MMVVKWITAFASVAVLASCGGGGGDSASGYPGAAVSCSATGERAWLRDFVNDTYFWFDQQGQPNDSATTIGDYFVSLLNKAKDPRTQGPVDRFSFSQPTAKFNQVFTEGKNTGYGYSFVFTDATGTSQKVNFVERGSPAALAGLLRGDTVITTNGLTPAQVSAGQQPFVDQVGVPRTLVVANPLGQQRTLKMVSAEYALNPVQTYKVLTAPSGAKVGYLLYQEFISSGAPEMGNAINSFRAAGVTEVVLDLRYNGGGSTLEARNLASMLGGSALDGDVFANYRFNTKNTNKNFVQKFVKAVGTNALPAAPLDNIRRVFVLTSRSTASASEMVINGLRPFKEVITIGGTTFGKPYGSVATNSCNTTFSLISFDLANKVGNSDYSAGFTPACAVSDDLSRQLGDPLELRTAAALNYISTGQCPISTQTQKESAQAASKSRASSEPEESLNFGDVQPPSSILER